MVDAILGALSDRLDSKFLIAYWLPAFVAVLGGMGLAMALLGRPTMEAWVYALDSVEQTLCVVITVFLITMVALVLQALSRPIAETFAGDALPRVVATWTTQGQLRAKRKAATLLGHTLDAEVLSAAASQAALRLYLDFPQNDAHARPTRFGNRLAAATEHAYLAYAMVAAHWWPRLSPLLPTEFQDLVASTQAPMMGLLNLSIVFAALALGGSPLLALAGGQWSAAIVVLSGGLLLSRLCYHAAVSQAAELGSLVRVAFDLYRTEILKQLAVETPSDRAAERALWQRLTEEVLALPNSGLFPHGESEAATASARPTKAAPNRSPEEHERRS